jgi:predicted O-methyltransferase YrrM
MKIRALRLGLLTVLGWARLGFFIPYRYAGNLPEPGDNPSYRAVQKVLAAQEQRFLNTLELVETFARDLESIGSKPPPAPRWEQDWFSRLDAAVLYSLIRHHRPRRVIEVGSGHSTRFVAQAVADGAFSCAITAIDPAPRATVTGLDIEFRRSTIQESGLLLFEELESGDFLIIDSSHVLMPGSDVDAILNRVLPTLPNGVWIHFHDVFLPDDYPRNWGWRGYNEQTAVAQLLFGGYGVEFSSHYLMTAMPGILDSSVVGRLPILPDARQSSLWLRKAL